MKDMEAISYSIAHDLRAPLQAVNGFASLLEQRERGTLSAQSRSMLQRIQGASRNMAQMIDDLLALFRVVRAELVMTPVDMEKLAHGAVAALDVGGATVAIGALPPARGDSTLLRQVFMNLIDNAVKYSRGVPSPHVEVGYEPATGAWFVRDNGVGFEMAYADKLFGVFQRLHAVADFQGSGVGLSVVSRIVERHGGRIWAEAAVGRGATFRFTLGPPD
jgi:light-regulated signal transduction histidine kinase (bacteriophytochrome)